MPSGALTDCLVAFGSNLGDGPELYQRAIALLRAHFADLHCSDLFQTRAIGPGPQPNYLNAAIRGRTAWSPSDVLRWLLNVERELGRQRSQRWTARTADLDLLLYGQHRGRTSNPSTGGVDLEIPHPRMSFRQFVLQPACQIAGDWYHPVCQATLQDLLTFLCERPNLVAIGDRHIWQTLWDDPPSESLTERRLTGGVTIARSAGTSAASNSTDPLHFNLVLVGTDSAWLTVAERAKFLVVRESPTGIVWPATWHGPLLAIPPQLATDELESEIAGALAATSPQSVLGVWSPAGG